MEFVVYVSIGVFCVSLLFGIPAFIWVVKDNKRREQMKQDEIQQTAVSQ